MKQKVVHVISSLKRGGAEVLLTHFLKREHQYDHEVIYFHDGPQRQAIEALGIKTHLIKGFVGTYDPLFWIRFISAARGCKPNIIHSWLWAANFVTRCTKFFLRVPVINSLHNNVDQDGAVRNRLDYLSYRFSDKIIAVSDGVVESVQSTMGYIPARLMVIKNGFQLPDEIMSVTRKDLGFASDDFIIGVVGRFVPIKNHSLILKAFAALAPDYKKIQLLVVGMGPDEEKLRLLAESLGIKDRVVFVVGKLADPYYPLFDCYCQSSDKESISMALLQAMALGIPAIITNPTMQHEVIMHGKTGLVLPSQNHRMYINALRRIIVDADYAQLLGKQGMSAVANNFSLEKMLQKYRAVYDVMIHNRNC